MAESEDIREFIREVMAPIDRRLDAIERRLDAEARERRADGAPCKDLEAMRRRTDERIAEGRAGRAELYRRIDELKRGRGGSGPAAAT